ncbi:MAG: hypothetical protein KF857_02030 [Fimbriimonadaceae bacterium]|nr:hypothetical protein [Fimbriimonadaceae bacterium]
MVTAVAIAALLNQGDIELQRKFTKGETVNYSVRSHILVEHSQYNQPIGIPEELDINYDSKVVFKDVKPTGFATIEYYRPTMTEIQGETAASPPKSKTDKVDLAFTMTMSPINEITDVTKIDGKKGGTDKLLRGYAGMPVSPATAQALSGFQGELYRLALWINSLDTSLEFNPKLPFEEVKPGATWKRTVSYQPQALKGGNGKQAVQRLDMTYKYEGRTQSKGQEVERVTATVHLDTDAAPFIDQLLGAKPGQSGLKAFKLKMDSTLTFDLDPKTFATIRATAKSKGSWSLYLVRLGDQPAVEEQITGESSLKRADR